MSINEYIHDQLQELEGKLSSVEDTARKAQGVSIEFRKCEPTWQKPWRLKVYVSKNSNEDKRITAYFDSHSELLGYLAEL